MASSSRRAARAASASASAGAATSGETSLADLLLHPADPAEVTDEGDLCAAREELVSQGQAADQVAHADRRPAIAPEADVKTHGHSVPHRFATQPCEAVAAAQRQGGRREYC